MTLESNTEKLAFDKMSIFIHSIASLLNLDCYYVSSSENTGDGPVSASPKANLRPMIGRE